MPHVTRWLALAAALVAAPSPGGAQAAKPAGKAARSIAITVHNDNFHDATVYALRPGLRQRLGWIRGYGKDSFTFRWPAGDLRLEIDLLANGRYYTQVMDVSEGDELELTILATLHMLPPGSVF